MNRILPPKVNRRTRRRYHNGTGDSLSNGALRITGVATSLFGGGKVLQRSREDLVSGDDRVLRERLVMREVSGAKTGLCQSREIKAVSYKMEVGSPCVHSSGLSLSSYRTRLSSSNTTSSFPFQCAFFRLSLTHLTGNGSDHDEDLSKWQNVQN